MKLLYIYILFVSFTCSNAKKPLENNHTHLQKSEVIATKQKVDDFYGFKFTIPQNWKKTVSNFKSIDLKGQIKTIETEYQINHNKLQLVYHKGKSGIAIFNNYYYSRRKNLFQTKINNMPAVKLIEQINRDGKGHLLSKAMERTKIFILDPKEKGCLEIVLDLKENHKEVMAEFESFLKSLKPTL